jgi:hypothetical protein
MVRAGSQPAVIAALDAATGHLYLFDFAGDMSSGKLDMNEYDLTVPLGLNRTVKSLLIPPPKPYSA